jgi:hypothetical protein
VSRRAQINAVQLAAKLFARRALIASATTCGDAIPPDRRVEAPLPNRRIALAHNGLGFEYLYKRKDYDRSIVRRSERTQLYPERAAAFWIFRHAYYAAAGTGGDSFG